MFRALALRTGDGLLLAHDDAFVMGATVVADVFVNRHFGLDWSFYQITRNDGPKLALRIEDLRRLGNELILPYRPIHRAFGRVRRRKK